MVRGARPSALEKAVPGSTGAVTGAGEGWGSITAWKTGKQTGTR